MLIWILEKIHNDPISNTASRKPGMALLFLAYCIVFHCLKSSHNKILQFERYRDPFHVSEDLLLHAVAHVSFLFIGFYLKSIGHPTYQCWQHPMGAKYEPMLGKFCYLFRPTLGSWWHPETKFYQFLVIHYLLKWNLKSLTPAIIVPEIREWWPQAFGISYAYKKASKIIVQWISCTFENS